MTQEYRPTRHRHFCRIFMPNLMLSGYVTSGHRYLVDHLNLSHANRILLEVVERREQAHSAHKVDGTGFASVNVSSIILVVLEGEATAPMCDDPMLWIMRRSCEVLLHVGGYEVAGCIHVPKAAKLDAFLEGAKDRFLLVTKATVKRIGGPHLVERYDCLLVNKEHTHFIISAALATVGQVEREA